MELCQIKAKKQVLEQEIGKMLVDFYNETGVIPDILHGFVFLEPGIKKNKVLIGNLDYSYYIEGYSPDYVVNIDLKI